MLKGFFVPWPCGRNAQYIVLFYTFLFYKNVGLVRYGLLKIFILLIQFVSRLKETQLDTLSFLNSSICISKSKETQQTDLHVFLFFYAVESFTKCFRGHNITQCLLTIQDDKLIRLLRSRLTTTLIFIT